MSCDPSVALTALRTTKYSLNVDPSTFTIVGRSSGNNINFNEYSYEERKMRRKAEVLKYTSRKNLILNNNNNNNITQNSRQSIFSTNNNINNYTRVNNTLILTNSNGEICDSSRIIRKSARNSGVPSNELLFLDSSIPFNTSL